MDPALIDPIVKYVQEEGQIADVSNTFVGNYREYLIFSYLVRYWFVCLPVSLINDTELISVWTVAAIALLVCYSNLCSLKYVKA
jgi:hypothetical protein